MHTRRNLYQGINAHLHSHLQHEAGGWKVFHNKHISDLAEALDARLPPGYEVGLTKSLQIVEYHPESGEKIRRPEPDVTIYALSQPQKSASNPGNTTTPTLALPALETIERDEDEYYTTVIIRRVTDPGKAVTRIELLSPTNKPPGDGYLQYREKRNASIEEGIPLIEMDYLHETRSPIRLVPSYPDKQPGSHAYLIAVTDPRPTPQDGTALIFGFDVDEPIPTINIPLAGDDLLSFDFQAVYNRTYESLSYFGNRVDYTQLPTHFETYSQADQKRIQARIEAIQNTP